MSVKAELLAALEGLTYNGASIDVSYLKNIKPQKSKPYVVLYQLTYNGSFYACDVEVEREYFWQVSVFSEYGIDTEPLIKEIESRLKNVGFIERPASPDLLEEDGMVVHKALTFCKTILIEGDELDEKRI